MNRAKFYAAVRPSLGRLSVNQVKGTEAILDLLDPSSIAVGFGAYVLATAWHETGREMMPIIENLNYSAAGLSKTFRKYFTPQEAEDYAHHPEQIANRAYANRMGNGDEASGDGWLYRGRGLVQITGRDNYAKAGVVLLLDLCGQPELALEPSVSSQILVYGLRDGWFTGKMLRNYVPPAAPSPNYIGARACVNGTDCAETVAHYATLFEWALRAAQ